MFTFAPAIAAPVPSVTMPEMSAFEVWAVTGRIADTAMNVAHSRTLDMKPSIPIPHNVREALILKPGA